MTIVKQCEACGKSFEARAERVREGMGRPNKLLNYIGTVQIENKTIVAHLFEEVR